MAGHRNEDWFQNPGAYSLAAGISVYILSILLRNAFWDGLYPNSIVVSETVDILIGMRHGVVRISTNSKVDWLIPDSPFSERVNVINQRYYLRLSINNTSLNPGH